MINIHLYIWLFSAITTDELHMFQI